MNSVNKLNKNDVKGKTEKSKPKYRAGQKSEGTEKQPPKPKTTRKTQDSAEVSTKKSLVPIIIMIIMFIIAIGFALVLAPIYVNLGLQADFSEFGGEQSLIIPFFYLAVILIFTGIILLITRKRKGSFIKYAFLGVICLSMMYVFYAVFDAVFFPLPPQKWSDEVELEGGISVIYIADLVGDNKEEIIIGTNTGYIEIYDHNRNLMWSTAPEQKLPTAIQDLVVVDLNQNGKMDLIVVSGNVNIFEFENIDGNYRFNYTWGTSRIDITSLAVIPNYPIRSNISLGRIPAVIVGYSSITGDSSGLMVISYYDNRYNSNILNNSLITDFPIFDLSYGIFNDSQVSELYIGSDKGIFSIGDPLNPTQPRQIIHNSNKIIEIIIVNIDNKGPAELVFWDETGYLSIYEANNQKPWWEKDVGKYIGGVVVEDFFEIQENKFKDKELVVSVDGRGYIYYSDDGFLNNKIEFTSDTGRLDRDATGLASGMLDDNDDIDILVGHSKGFKHYQYIHYSRSDVPCFIGLVVAIVISVFLFYHPEWYIVDIVGIIVAGGVTALIGISIGLLPLLVLLIILAIYDAISVYKTKHMVSLADKVMEFKLPILLVVPKKRGYSFLRQKGLQEQLDEGEEREAMFIGLGDIIIPGTLVISAFHFLPVTSSWFGLDGNLLVAIFTLVGTLLGFSALMHFVLKGNPQAGLPLLNTGAILGFFISNFMIYQDITFGLVLPFG